MEDEKPPNTDSVDSLSSSEMASLSEEIDAVSKEENLSPELEQIVAEVLVRSYSISRRFRGPLPPPSVLQEYDDVQKGFADRIIAIAEKQQDHRHRIESRIVYSNTRLDQMGLIFGFIVAVMLISVGFLLIISDKDVQGIVLIAGTIAGIVYAFTYTQRQQSKKDAKEQPQEDPDSSD